MRDLLWAPIFAWPLLAISAALIATAIAWSLWRGLHDRRRAVVSGALRIAALLLLVLLFLQPQKRRDEVTILRPQLAVLIDTSESMAGPVDESQPSRADRVREWLASPALAKARDAFDVRLFGFDTKVDDLPADAKNAKFQGGGSNVVLAVNQVLERFRGQPLAAIALLSDGLDTSGAAQTANVSAGVPVLAFELEKPFQPKEKGKRLSVASVDFPARIVIGWDQEIRAGIAGSGMSGATVAVELWRDGKKEKAATVAFNEDNQTLPVVFPLAAEKPGMMQFELRVNDPAADKEAQAYPFVIEAIEPGKRLLYVQNTLGFDFKFLRRAIVADRNLQLSAFVRWGDGRLVSMGERGVPAQAKLDLTANGLAKYSVVLLGDLPPDTFTAENYQALKEFVNRGGGLVLLGDSHGLASPEIARTALAEISPVKLPAEYREKNAAVTITDAGLRHPVFGPLFNTIKDFPPLLTVNIASGASPTAEVLMETNAGGGSTPLIAASRFGQGRVVVVLSDTIWRWRLAAKSWSQEKSPFDTFWTQLMDWLIPKEQDKQGTNRIELFTERSNYLMGERPEVRAIVRLIEPDAKPPATLLLSVKTPDDKTFDYTMKAATLPTPGGGQVPGYRVEVEPNVPGVFGARSGANLGGVKIEGETRFVVTKPATELTSKPLNRELLQSIAEQSGGKFYPIEAAKSWPGDVRAKEQQFARVQVVDLWNHPVLLGLLFALLAADWIARKRWHLP
jgi:uncharacterized membrane protein